MTRAAVFTDSKFIRAENLPRLVLIICKSSLAKKNKLMPPATNNISHLNPLRGIIYRKVAGMKDAKLYP